MSNIAEKAKILVECEVRVINKISIEIKYEINIYLFFLNICTFEKRIRISLKKMNNTNKK